MVFGPELQLLERFERGESVGKNSYFLLLLLLFVIIVIVVIIICCAAQYLQSDRVHLPHCCNIRVLFLFLTHLGRGVTAPLGPTEWPSCRVCQQ